MGLFILLELGKQVRIWNEPWLPDPQNQTVQTPLLQELELARESSLMVSDGIRWEEDILNDIFNTRDRDLILKIPLGMEDR